MDNQRAKTPTRLRKETSSPFLELRNIHTDGENSGSQGKRLGSLNIASAKDEAFADEASGHGNHLMAPPHASPVSDAYR